jgi:hypothetical protein
MEALLNELCGHLGQPLMQVLSAQGPISDSPYVHVRSIHKQYLHDLKTPEFRCVVQGSKVVCVLCVDNSPRSTLARPLPMQHARTSG